MRQKIINSSKFLELVFDAATSYIPPDELNDNQKEKLDNLTCKWCNCHFCKTELKVGNEIIRPQYEGHAQSEKNEIRISRNVIGSDDEIPRTLTEIIHIILHEVVHVLFPEYSEDETENKTKEWLRRSIWSQGWLPYWSHL